jgi:SAM-dependent methyltransferase
VSSAPWLRPCPVCGAADANALHFNRLAPLDGHDLSYRVASCAACRFAFADRLAAPETYERYYRSLSKYDIAASALEVPEVDRMRARATVDLVAAHVDRKARIIDLGCGSGVLLDALRRAGWSRLAGLDPAPGASERARRLFALEEVHSGSLRDLPPQLEVGNAGLVCLAGVLEHLPRLREDLEALVSRLAPDAKVLVEVPALERFGPARFEPFGEFSLEHLQYFSAASLSALFAALGFRPLALELVGLQAGTTDSVLALFARGEAPRLDAPDDLARLQSYVERSARAMAAVLARIDACDARRIFIYGAGSHSSRLLPELLARGMGDRLAGIVDANPNLQGKPLGPLAIEAPEALARDPRATVLLSTFRSQEPVARALAAHYANPLLRLYDSGFGAPSKP